MTRPMLAMLNRRTQASAGFTLLESLIVIVLLGIVAAYAIPRTFNTSALTLRSQARTFASDLQRAQLLAITTGSKVDVTISTGSYVISSTSTQPAVPSVTVPLANDASFVGATSPILLSFDSLGRPSISGDFQMTASASLLTINVNVTPLTGLIALP